MAAKQYIALMAVFLLFLIDVDARECNDKVYLINFFYDENSNLKFDGNYEAVGCFPSSNSLNPYIFEIKKDSRIYYSTSFDYKVIYTDALDEGVIVGGAKKAFKTKFTLVVPYREDIDGFVVREGQNTILSVDKATFYSTQEPSGQQQGLFGWVEGLLKGLFGNLFS